MAEDMILEIGTEELPSGFITPALEQLKDMMTQELGGYRIQFREIITWGTPRRLVLYVREVGERQSDVIKEV
ncbi:MAG TPA: glycine--tRNA ligase subunit beta, partial [Candidatus Eremiobacteraeota bacterium]|nr:glycine--tRNA ligase subunit beta [Candidatus Eremiobacteraeota bacterium]